MITKLQAMESREFHFGECSRVVGPRGGVKLTQTRLRRNGKTQTWVTRPDHFRVPIKTGFYDYGQITQDNAYHVHTLEDCNVRA